MIEENNTPPEEAKEEIAVEVKETPKEAPKGKASFIVSTGRRKEAIARVFLSEGSGKILVNKRSFENYFPRESHRIIINQPVKLAGLENKLDVSANLIGGGPSGQAYALRHAIARAIVKLDQTKKQAIKKAGFLTRDSRAKERKKYGRKRARRRFQYTKR